MEDPFVPIEILKKYKEYLDGHHNTVESNIRQLRPNCIKEVEKISVGALCDMFTYLEQIVKDHNLMPKKPQEQQMIDSLLKIQNSIND
jgi:CTP:phosphocholine cytidylyltransferase-like protein